MIFRMPVKIVLDSSHDDGYFVLPRTTGKRGSDVGEITLGIAARSWEHTLSLLIHELGEMAMVMHGGRYERSATASDDNGHVCFWLQHRDWSDVAASISKVLCKVQDPVHKAFRESIKKGEKS